jgi:hypothetical protein
MRNAEFTTPLAGTPDYRVCGIIRAALPHGETACVCDVEYRHFDDEQWEYVFTPHWDVIDGVPKDAFQGVPGLDLARHQPNYYRVNMTPVFITERTPSPEREDLWELLASVGLDYYDRLEWLLRTDMTAGNDNLTVGRRRESPVLYAFPEDGGDQGFIAFLGDAQPGDTLEIARLESLAATPVGFEAALTSLLLAGVDIRCGDGAPTIDAASRPALLAILLTQKEILYSRRRAVQREGIERAKASGGKYRGRKRLPYDVLKLEEACTLLDEGKVTVAEAMQIAGLASRSSFYRRRKERDCRYEEP